MVEVEKGPIRWAEQHDGGRLLGLRCNLRTYYSPISTDPTADLASALEAVTFGEIVHGARPGDWSPWGRDLVVESTPTILPDWRRRFAFSPNSVRLSLGGMITGTDVELVRGQPPLPGHLEDNLFFTLCGLAHVLGDVSAAATRNGLVAIPTARRTGAYVDGNTGAWCSRGA